MLTANISTDKVVIARDVSKYDGPFLCPACNEELVIKKGWKKVHHFAHRSQGECRFGVGETQLHYQSKLAIYDELMTKVKHGVEDPRLERGLGAVRPDVSFSLGEYKLAIEVQVSNIGQQEIYDRTQAYYRLGYAVLWTHPIENDFDDVYKPRQWEKYLHALYFGQVFYWIGGLCFQPVEYEYYSRSLRVPNKLPEVRMGDMRVQKRRAWVSDNMRLPTCKLLTKSKLC